MNEPKDYFHKRHDDGSIRLGKFAFAQKTPFLSKQMYRKGFKNLDLLAHWGKIVGEILKQYSLPDSIKNISGKKTLFIHVFATRVIEFQHQKNDIIERVNIMAGFQLIDDIHFIRCHKVPKSKYSLPKPITPPLFEQHPFWEKQKTEFSDKSLQDAFNHLAHYILPVIKEEKIIEKPSDSVQKPASKKAWLVEYEKQQNSYKNR